MEISPQITVYPLRIYTTLIELHHKKNCFSTCAVNEGLGHQCRLIKAFGVRMRLLWILGMPQTKQWLTDYHWTEALANLYRHWSERTSLLAPRPYFAQSCLSWQKSCLMLPFPGREVNVDGQCAKPLKRVCSASEGSDQLVQSCQSFGFPVLTNNQGFLDV